MNSMIAQAHIFDLEGLTLLQARKTLMFVPVCLVLSAVRHEGEQLAQADHRHTNPHPIVPLEHARALDSVERSIRWTTT